MKRSEMIKAIRDFNRYENPHDDAEFAEQILTFIEGRGMLPPPEVFEKTTQCIAYAYYPNVVSKGDIEGTVDLEKSQLWESEDLLNQYEETEDV